MCTHKVSRSSHSVGCPLTLLRYVSLDLVLRGLTKAVTLPELGETAMSVWNLFPKVTDLLVPMASEQSCMKGSDCGQVTLKQLL